MSGRYDDHIRIRVSIRDDSDVVVTRRLVREVARREGLSETAKEALATAATELARNILVHATTGEILVGSTVCGALRGVVVIARDEGPGIPDVAQAMTDGYSTGSGLGLGLPSARRLVDEFEVTSAAGAGTTATLRKWVSEHGT